jgi:hypothetical protein
MGAARKQRHCSTSRPVDLLCTMNTHSQDEEKLEIFGK